MGRRSSIQVKYLSAEEILIIHSEIIDKTGGLHGLRDAGLLASTMERPKTSFGGNEIFKTVFEKAATYFESLAMYHVFLDGNKRTAIVASARFLYINNFELTATNREVENFVLKIIKEKLEIKEIAVWLKKHSKKT
ncbi:MAG: type II toxin-antitoxin system death-on-curing family toxin [bacterium]|nr:type II toxin-antitoxin system death-on-curing family toxin [bacterium]